MAPDRSDTLTAAEQAKRLHFAETLLHVSRTVSAMETLDDVLAALIEMTVTETDSDRGTLFLNDPATGELYSRVAAGRSDARDPHAQRHRHRRPGLHRPTNPSSSTMPMRIPASIATSTS